MAQKRGKRKIVYSLFISRTRSEFHNHFLLSIFTCCPSLSFSFQRKGDKQKSKKRRTRPGDEEGGALSTTQKINWNIFEKINKGKDVPGSSENKGTQELDFEQMGPPDGSYTQEAVPESQVPETQLPLDLFVEANVQNSPQIVGNYFIGNTIIPKATVNTILTAAVDVNFRASDDMFTLRESYMLAKILTEQRRLYEVGEKVGIVINTLRLNFEHYCGLMKKGKKSKVIRYDYDSGMCFPTALDQGEWSVVWNQYQHVIENFDMLKKLFPKIHNLPRSSTISGKRKSSTVGTSRGSKKSKSTSSVNNLYSSKTLRVKFRIKDQISFVSEDFLHELLVRYFEGNDAKCHEFLEYNDDRFCDEILKMLRAIKAGAN